MKAIGIILIFIVAAVAADGDFIDKNQISRNSEDLPSSIFNELDNLDLPSLLNVLDLLNFTELINVAVNGKFRQIIIDHYMLPIYHIDTEFVHIRKHRTWDRPSEHNITIGNYASSIKFLRHFGHLITKLAHNPAGFFPREVDELERHIVKYCGGSLIEFDLVDFDYMYRPNWMKALQSVHSIRLGVARKFPLIKFISEEFPHLESFAMNYYPTDCAEVYPSNAHFPNVRKFEIYTDFLSGRTVCGVFPITFDQLESLDIKMSLDVDQITPRILYQNPSLKSFSFINKHPAESEIIEHLKYVPSLEEFTFEWSPETRGMDAFPWQQLKKITFIVSDDLDSQTNRNHLMEIIPNGWNLINEKEDRTASRVSILYYITATKHE